MQAEGLLHIVRSQPHAPMTQPGSHSHVFSTKDRQPLLDPEIRPRMHAYLATVCRDSQCEAYRVGGVADHVHLAVRLGRTITQSELLEKIKKSSSAWIKTQAINTDRFSGRLVTVASPLGTVNSMNWCVILRNKNRIIKRKPFRKNIANYCASIAWILTSDTCGTKQPNRMRRAFSAWNVVRCL